MGRRTRTTEEEIGEARTRKEEEEGRRRKTARRLRTGERRVEDEAVGGEDRGDSGAVAS